jgi:hypothetical protein
MALESRHFLPLQLSPALDSRLQIHDSVLMARILFLWREQPDQEYSLGKVFSSSGKHGHKVNLASDTFSFERRGERLMRDELVHYQEIPGMKYGTSKFV